MHVTEDKDKSTIKALKDYFDEKELAPEKVEHVSMDMSPSFIVGVHEHSPQSEIHFDRFHIVKLLNEAMDAVRKAEIKEHDELKSKDKLSSKKREDLAGFITLYPTLCILERINSKIQRVKKRVRDYRTTKSLINMIYFLCGKLKFAYSLISI